MSKILLASMMCALFGLIGCGSSGGDTGNPDKDGNQYSFAGAWSGTLTSNTSPCSDGSTYPAQSLKVTWSVAAVGSSQLVSHIACGDLYLTQQGNVATQTRDITCAPQVTPTAQVTPTIHDGSLVLVGNALQVDILFDFAVVSGGKSGSCNNIHTAGVLVKQ